MSCQVQSPRLTNFVAGEGYVNPVNGPWEPGYPNHVTYPSKDYVRARSGCSTNPKINGWRSPSSYSSAHCYYIGESFDYTTTFRKRLFGRTSQGIFLGGIASLGGILDFQRWCSINTGVCSNLIFDNALYNSSIAEATAKVAARKLDAAESTAEIGKTIKTLIERIHTAAAAYKALRRGDPYGLALALGFSPNGKRFSKNAANLWLETQYHWKPLLADIYGISKVIENGLRDNKGILSAKVSKSDTLSFKFGPPFGIGIWDHDASVRIKATTEFYFSIWSPWLATLESLGILNPIALGWNLLPFSFVIDWLLPVGLWASNLTATLGTTYLGGYTTYSTRTVERAKWADISEAQLYRGTVPKGHIVVNQFQRVAHYTWPEANVYVKSPFSATRAVTALALLRQLRK